MPFLEELDEILPSRIDAMLPIELFTELPFREHRLPEIFGDRGAVLPLDQEPDQARTIRLVFENGWLERTNEHGWHVVLLGMDGLSAYII